MILRRLLIAIVSALLLAGCKVDADFSDNVDTRILPAKPGRKDPLLIVVRLVPVR